MTDFSRLGPPVGAGLESIASVETADGARRRLEDLLKSPAISDELRQVLEIQAAASLQAMGEGAEAGALGTDGRIGLEALVRTTGRPALPVKNGTLDLTTAEAVTAGPQLKLFLPLIERAARSIGRIELNGAHVGTGWVVSDGLILTNRHVLEVIAKAYPRPDRPPIWMLKAGEPSIDFIREEGSDRRLRFRILEVVGAGPDAINNQINFKNLDAALLRIADVGDDQEEPPRPLAMLDPGSPTATSAAVGVVAIGFPGPARYAPMGPQPTAEEAEIAAALSRIFGLTSSVKRVSPGVLMQRAGEVEGDARKWVLSHDCTTLGGASGAAVIRLQGEDPVVMGLHFGGALLKANWAHLLPAIKPGIFDGSGGVYRWAS